MLCSLLVLLCSCQKPVGLVKQDKRERTLYETYFYWLDVSFLIILYIVFKNALVLRKL